MRDLGKKDDGLFDDKIGFTPYSVENDPFDVRNFEELKTHSKKLLETEDKGSKEYEQFPELQQDLFDALYKNNVDVNPEWKMKREFLLNRKIMETMIASQRYKELRVLTQLDIINSTVGAELLSDETLDLVKNELKKEREALENLMEAGDALDQASGQASGQGTQGQGQGGGKRGKKSPEQTLEEAKQAYEEAMEKFQEVTQRAEFKRSVDRITTKVKDEVRETSDLISNWGLESSGSFQRRSPHEQMALLDKLRNSSKLKKIAQLAGKFRRLAQLHRREKVKEGTDETYSVKQGSDVARLVPSEMLRMLTPVTRKQFLLDLMEGKTVIYQVQGKQKKGKGPVIICIDSSGSMDGPPGLLLKFIHFLVKILQEKKKIVPIERN